MPNHNTFLPILRLMILEGQCAKLVPIPEEGTERLCWAIMFTELVEDSEFMSEHYGIPNLQHWKRNFSNYGFIRYGSVGLIYRPSHVKYSQDKGSASLRHRNREKLQKMCLKIARIINSEAGESDSVPNSPIELSSSHLDLSSRDSDSRSISPVYRQSQSFIADPRVGEPHSNNGAKQTVLSSEGRNGELPLSEGYSDHELIYKPIPVSSNHAQAAIIDPRRCCCSHCLASRSFHAGRAAHFPLDKHLRNTLISKLCNFS